jgi:hypothetical protein
MSSPAKIQVLKDAAGAPVYRVALGVGGSVSVVRDFKSKEDAEQFVAPDRMPSNKRKGDRKSR